MKIRFTETPIGRDHKVGDVVEFKGPVEETYARKYISRGWAVDLATEARVVEQPKPEPKPVGNVKAEVLPHDGFRPTATQFSLKKK